MTIPGPDPIVIAIGYGVVVLGVGVVASLWLPGGHSPSGPTPSPTGSEPVDQDVSPSAKSRSSAVK